MSYVSFTALGGCREVGKNAFLVETQKKKYLMDYGIQVQDSLLPLKAPKDLSGVFLSHAHLDHCGAIPLLYKRGYRRKTFLTSSTLFLAEMLMKDSIKVQDRRGQQPYFLMPDVKEFIRNKFVVNYRTPVKIDGGRAEFYSAGHTPGSCTTLLDVGGKRILYTGDIKFEDTELINGADTDIKNVDVLISETTYTHKNHPDRKKLADRLRQYIQETVYNNGTAILPSFAVGRTQEILLLVQDLGFPVYIDGMGIEATNRILLSQKYIKNPEKLKKAFGRAHKVRSMKDRLQAVRKPSVVITTAGMLQGGPVNYYIKKLHKRPDCSLIITGYQAEGTVGRVLIDTGKYVTETMNEKLKMRMEIMDFSGHCGRDNLIKFYKKLNPEKIILVHGEHNEKFVKDVSDMGFDAVAPKNGQKIFL